MGYSCTKSMANTGCIGWDKTVVTTLIGSVNLKNYFVVCIDNIYAILILFIRQ